MRTLRIPDGALPMATSLTSQPVGPLNFDQSPPGSPTPTSAKVTVPFEAANARDRSADSPLATASPAPPTAAAWPWRHDPLPRRRAESRLTSYRPYVVAPGSIHVHDGDTFYVGAETIRLRGVDTPELGQPKSAAATRRLIQLLHSGPVTIVPRAEDVYGRIVAEVYVRGHDVAKVLREEGFEKPHPR